MLVRIPSVASLLWLLVIGVTRISGLLRTGTTLVSINTHWRCAARARITQITAVSGLRSTRLRSRIYLADTIVSPFDSSRADELAERKIGGLTDDDKDLPLTAENVERVLDEMRPYLQADGGDVKLVEIDGPVVKLELVGACGTCPSSTMTMKMGLERKLKERIPEIEDVIQSLPDAPELNNCNLETVLDGVRPFLKVAGGKISVESLSGVGSMQPGVKLKMEGTAASLQSVKSEIMQRIQRHFKIAVRVEWV